MRAIEFINEAQEIDEIRRLSLTDFAGGKQYLTDKEFGKQVKKLPGGSRFLYSISNGRWEGTVIKIWDPQGKDYLAHKARCGEPKPVRKQGESIDKYTYRVWAWERSRLDANAPGQLIGRLSVSDVGNYRFPIKGALQVDSITVDEDYRGAGIAKSLYGIVLTIMKRPLLAGDSQTPGGRRNWVSLASIPGVEMKGYFVLDENELDTELGRYRGVSPQRANNNIDTIMGQLGGQYIGSTGYGEYFAFDVQPDTTNKELKAYVDTKLSKLYGGHNSATGLYAIWHGK